MIDEGKSKHACAGILRIFGLIAANHRCTSLLQTVRDCSVPTSTRGTGSSRARQSYFDSCINLLEKRHDRDDRSGYTPMNITNSTTCIPETSPAPSARRKLSGCISKVRIRCISPDFISCVQVRLTRLTDKDETKSQPVHADHIFAKLT